jgi:hypothetical protein
MCITVASCSNSTQKLLDEMVANSPVKEDLIQESGIDSIMVKVADKELIKTICTFNNPKCAVDSFNVFYYKATKTKTGFYDLLIVQRDTTSYPTSNYYYLVFDEKGALKSKTFIWSVMPDSEFGTWLVSIKTIAQTGVEITYNEYVDELEENSKEVVKLFSINADGTIKETEKAPTVASKGSSNNQEVKDLGLTSIIGNVTKIEKNGAQIQMTVDMQGDKQVVLNTADKTIFYEKDLIDPDNFDASNAIGKTVVIRAVPQNLQVNGQTVKAFNAYSVFAYKENCFENAAISNAKNVYRNLHEIGEMVRKGDKNQMVCLFDYPFTINGEKAMTIKSKEEALEKFDVIFTPSVKMALLNTTFNDAFSTYEGVTIASGKVWFKAKSESDEELRIYVINAD